MPRSGQLAGERNGKRVGGKREREGEREVASKVAIVVSPKFLTGNGPKQKVHTKLSYLELRRAKNEQHRNCVT